LDLRLTGIDLESIRPLEKQLLEDRILDRDTIEYYKMMAIIVAIQEAASVVAGRGSDYSKTSKLVRKVRDLYFPEIAEETEEKAGRVEALVKGELDKGPMKVQRLDYNGKRKKRR
jgi:hypothetical protein